MTLTCDQTCWGDGPYPDLADFGDTVWIGGVDTGYYYLSGGIFGLLNSYVLTDPAPLVRANTRTPGKVGSHPRIAHTEQRIVDLDIRVSGMETVLGVPNADPVAGVETNVALLRAATIGAAHNLLGGVTGGVPLWIVRKTGEVRYGLVQFDEFTTAPGRNSRTVTTTVTLPLGGLVVDPAPPTW